jgi:TPP-dependent pyruvate/acetoin dehydrogenase alpha subunit
MRSLCYIHICSSCALPVSTPTAFLSPPQTVKLSARRISFETPQLDPVPSQTVQVTKDELTDMFAHVTMRRAWKSHDNEYKARNIALLVICNDGQEAVATVFRTRLITKIVGHFARCHSCEAGAG